MVVKLDMSKTYERVEWLFLEKVMKKMGFTDSWVRLIMRYLSFVSRSVMIDRVPS